MEILTDFISFDRFLESYDLQDKKAIRSLLRKEGVYLVRLGKDYLVDVKKAGPALSSILLKKEQELKKKVFQKRPQIQKNWVKAHFGKA